MIKVLFVGMSSDLGGIETFIMNYYRNIDKQKVTIDFLAFEEKICFQDEITEAGGRIYYIAPRRSGLAYYISLINFFRNQKDYQIIHSNMVTCSSIAPITIAKLFGLKTISHSHNDWKGKSRKTLILHYMNRCILNRVSDYKFACSIVAGQWLFGKNVKFTLIPNSIDVSKFIYSEEMRNIKRKELEVEKKLLIGHIGRFENQKNHGFLLEIFKQITEIRKDSVLILVGDGKLKSDIIEKIHALDLEKSVVLLGLRFDISELFQAFDVFLLPSLFEGFPMTLIEAQASGIPSVISDDITPDIIITDLVKQVSLDEDARVWAEVIIEYYNEKRRKNTYEQICSRGYDINSSALELENIYKKISNQI